MNPYSNHHHTPPNNLLSNSLPIRIYSPNTPHYYPLSYHPLSIQQSLIASAHAEGKGKWSTHQHSLYIQFLSRNIQKMSNSLSRRTNKVFFNMSRIITTRTADQCRSHHQKILKYHSSVQDIIERYQRGIRGDVDNKKKQEWTRAEQTVQGFYTLNRVGSVLSYSILQSAIESFRL